MKRIYLKRCKAKYLHSPCKKCDGIILENYLDGTLTINKSKARRFLYSLVALLLLTLWMTN